MLENNLRNSQGVWLLLFGDQIMNTVTSFRQLFRVSALHKNRLLSWNTHPDVRRCHIYCFLCFFAEQQQTNKAWDGCRCCSHYCGNNQKGWEGYFHKYSIYLLLKRVSWPQMDEKSLQTQQVGKTCCNKGLFSLLCSKSENCSGLLQRTNSLFPKNRKNWDIHPPDVDNNSGSPRKITKMMFLCTINLQAIMAIVYCLALSSYLVLSLCYEWFWKTDLNLFQELWDFCLFWLPKGYTAPNTFYFFNTLGQSSREMLQRTFLVKSYP